MRLWARGFGLGVAVNCSFTWGSAQVLANVRTRVLAGGHTGIKHHKS
jgi:hypothetical protein